MEKNVVITNNGGIHARAASIFVRNANMFDSKIEIKLNEKIVDVKSIMGVMSLALNKGSEVTLMINGIDEQKAMKALVPLIEGGFSDE